MKTRALPTGALLLAVLAGCAGERGETALPSEPADYVAQIERHRAEREERLAAEDGWLALSGLFWLVPGDNPFGSAPDLPVVLPDGPPRAGVLHLEGGEVRLVAEPGVAITLDGQPVRERGLVDDGAGRPDVLTLGRVRFHVIARGGRHGVRVKDPESPARREFAGIDYYAIDPRWRVRAAFRPFEAPREVAVDTVIETTEPMLAPGTLEFTLDGQRWSLMPLIDRPDDRELFLIFRDATSGRETYGAGRYLYATLEEDGAWLDFNKAYNPPCAFTPYATCPLPPPQNRLDLSVEAGEKLYHGPGAAH